MTNNVATIIDTLQKGTVHAIWMQTHSDGPCQVVEFNLLDKEKGCEHIVELSFDADDFLTNVDVTLGKKDITVTTHETDLSR